MNITTPKAVLRPAFTGSDWVRIGLGAAIVGLVYYAYFVQLVGIQMSTCRWLIQHWAHVSNYSHGPLIPLIAVGIAWMKRDEVKAASLVPVSWGAVVVAGAMLFYFVGIKAVEPRTVVFSFVVLLYGLTLALGGRELFRQLFFPITFLLLMIPLNFLDEKIGFPLRMFVASAATFVLNLLGVDAIQRGSGISIVARTSTEILPLFSFDVADPCSGIRSLMALTTVTAAYGYVTQHVQWKRWVLFLSAMPLAVLGNMARVASIALVAKVYGKDLATKTYHDYSGYIVFGVALSAMVIIGLLLNFPYRDIFENWFKPPTDNGPHDDGLLPPD